jgi:hypothetical protein
MKYSAKPSDAGHVISLKRWRHKNLGCQCPRWNCVGGAVNAAQATNNEMP